MAPLADVDWARMQSLHILSFNRSELAAAVAGIAAAFGAADVLLQLAARPLAERVLRAGRKSHSVEPKDVTKALPLVLSFLHLAVQIPVALGVVLDPKLTADPVYGVSSLSLSMVTISSGYFLYDLGCCLTRLHVEGTAFLVHALCCLFVYGYAVFFGTLHWFGAAFLLWELSTPFVNIRWLLAKMGLDNTKLYIANGLAMLGVFFLCRNVWGVYCSVRFFQATQVELDAPRPGGFSAAGIWGYRMANVSLNLLNLKWFSMMLSKAIRLMGGTRKGTVAGSSKEL